MGYGYAVVKESGKVGSKYYQFKNERERKVVPNALSLLSAHSNLEVVTLSNLEVYAEYAPYEETKTLKELFNYVNNYEDVEK